MSSVKIGLMGLGTVGSGVVRILEHHKEDLEKQVGSPIEIAKILVRDPGKTRPVDVRRDLLTDDPGQLLDHPDIDVIVEVMGGVDPARRYILAALERGKHVVTANKDLMAVHGPEILGLAARKNCDVFYEASVAGGIPIIRTLTESFSSDRITKIMGIVNGTTNYILSKMSRENAAYETALREAQQLGYAEADPTSDVEGLDAARKMAILATLGFRTFVSLDDVDVLGITRVTPEDIRYAKRLGYEIKLLGVAERHDDAISVAVQPTMIRNTHPLSAVGGVFNAVYVYGEAVGETMFYGPGAVSLPTATSVVADLVAVVRNLKLGVNGRRVFAPYRQKKLLSADRIVSRYFLLLNVDDRAGVLARITQVFADFEVSLESVVQQPDASGATAEIVVVTHEASKAAMDGVIGRLRELAVVRRVKSVYRVVG